MDHDDAAVRQWMSRLDSRGALRVFERFYDGCLVRSERLHNCMSKYGFDGEVSPKRVADFQAKAVERDRFLVGMLARNWINGQTWTLKTKRTRLGQINSFFLHNYAGLPKDLSFRFSNSKEPVLGDLQKDDLVTIIRSSNPMYACIFTFIAQAFLDTKRLCYINQKYASDIVEAVTKHKGIIRLPLPPRKNSPEPYFTLVETTHSDFATTFRTYLRTTTHDVRTILFLNEQGNPVTPHNISKYFYWRGLETGVVRRLTPSCPQCGAKTVRKKPRLGPDGAQQIVYDCQANPQHRTLAAELSREWKRKLLSHRTGKHVHEIFDLMRSRYRASGAAVQAIEFFRGHKLDRNEYDKMKYTPGYAETQYRKALNWLNILSMDPEKISRSQLDVDLAAQNAKVEVLSRELAVLRKRQQVFEHPLFVEWLEEKMRELEAEQ